MQRTTKRVLTAILALCTLVSLLAPAAPAMPVRAAEELVNVALLGTATTLLPYLFLAPLKWAACPPIFWPVGPPAPASFSPPFPRAL